MLEKNGNTFEPGQRVLRVDSPTAKTAGRLNPDNYRLVVGEVKHVDTEGEQVLVKWAHGEEWVGPHQIARYEGRSEVEP